MSWLLSLLLVCRGIAMTVPYEVVAEGDVQTTVDQVFAQVDATFNDWNPDSEISRVNRLPAGERMEISEELAAFLHQVGELVGLTGGLFDPTGLNLEAAGWQNIHLEGRTLWKEDGRTGLLLGGIAKGHAVDLLREALGTDAYINWGGEIATKGHHPEGRPWRIGVKSPTDEGAFTILDLTDAALATSGDYEQDAHIYNPLTWSLLEPGPGMATSSTVVAPSAMEADAIATALMVAGTKPQVEQFLSHLEAQRPEIRALVLFR
jgi:FAD:protein FMN transferase